MTGPFALPGRAQKKPRVSGAECRRNVGRTAYAVRSTNRRLVQPLRPRSDGDHKNALFAARAELVGRRSVAAYAPACCCRPAPGAALLGTARSCRGTVPFTHLAREGRMTVTTGRRELLVALGGAAAAWPLAARAQQRRRLPTIGFLGAPTLANGRLWLDAFVQRLRELGWIEGHTIAIEARWAEGRGEGFAGIAAEFVRLKVDVIVTSGAAVVAAKQTTSVIPIVFPAAPDPLGSGLVASLVRPGGNVTGLSMQQPDLASKRVGLLREVVPGLRRLAILANVDYPSAAVEMGEVQATARILAFEVTKLEIRRGEEIAAAFEALKGGADALYVCSEPLVNTNRVRVNTLALGARLPTMYGYREFVDSGGLMSYGPNIPDLFRRAGDYVNKILRGAKPADLPVQQPTKFDLVINLTTAKTLGLEVPPTLLARADEVIE